MAELIVRGIQVTGGIHLGVIEAHQEEELHLGIEAEEAGHEVHPYHVALGTVIVIIVVATAIALVAVGPLFAAVLQLMCLDLTRLRRLGGEGPLLRVGANQNRGPRWTLSLQSRQAKQGQGQGQGHLLEVQMVKRAWSLMMMVHQTREGELGKRFGEIWIFSL